VNGRPDVLVRRSSRALWRRVHNEVVATTSSDTDVHDLAGGAGHIWEELAAPRSREGLARVLADRFDEPVHELRPQVAACIAELVALGLVEEVDAADA
jgi:coenzyme PQQ synthesis protein D (PqqD)